MKFDCFRLYYGLMNVAFLGIIFGFTENFVLSNLGFDLDPENAMLEFLYKSFGIVIILLPIFLIVAKFMRDDYAEFIWKKTAHSFLYIFSAVPLLFILPNVFAWIATYFFRPEISGQIDTFVFEDSPFSLMYEVSAYSIVSNIWLFSISFFVILFQWHRWRDSR